MAFRSGRGSDRSRRMLVMQAQEELADELPSSEAFSEELRIRVADEAEMEGSTALSRLSRALRRKTPATWVFTGDSTSAEGIDARFSRQLFDGISQAWKRPSDISIESSAPALNVSDVRRQLYQRVMRFQPEVIVLSLGLPESSHLTNGLRIFENNLFEIAETLRQSDSVLLINTPPRVGEFNGELTARVQEYVDTLRSACAEWDMLLINHWENWTSPSPRISTVTHTQMARLALQQIQDWLRN